MSDRPLSFKAPMIRALLDGRKSQTRRVLKPQPPTDARYAGIYFASDEPNSFFFNSPQGPFRVRQSIAEGDCPWVRENGWERPERTTKMMRDGADTWEPFYYDADDLACFEHEQFKAWGFKRRPSIHMPRWASRLTLLVTDVRVQRVQEISEEDAIAEGMQRQEGDGLGPGPGFKWKGTGYHAGTMSDWGACYHTPHNDGRPGCSCNVAGPSPAQCAFRELWDRINGERPGCSWSDNPWVVAISFRCIHQNIDQIERDAA